MDIDRQNRALRYLGLVRWGAVKREDLSEEIQRDVEQIEDREERRRRHEDGMMEGNYTASDLAGLLLAGRLWLMGDNVNIEQALMRIDRVIELLEKGEFSIPQYAGSEK